MAMNSPERMALKDVKNQLSTVVDKVEREHTRVVINQARETCGHRPEHARASRGCCQRRLQTGPAEVLPKMTRSR